MATERSFSALLRQTIAKIDGAEKDSERIVFTCADGSRYRMYYDHDCCAFCTVEDICGDIQDLLYTEILLAEEMTQSQGGVNVDLEEGNDSFTWTFYRLATSKGYVTIRWFGSSNGYYSESVTFEQLDADEQLDAGDDASRTGGETSITIRDAGPFPKLLDHRYADIKYETGLTGEWRGMAWPLA